MYYYQIQVGCPGAAPLLPGVQGRLHQLAGQLLEAVKQVLELEYYHSYICYIYYIAIYAILYMPPPAGWLTS